MEKMVLDYAGFQVFDTAEPCGVESEVQQTMTEVLAAAGALPVEPPSSVIGQYLGQRALIFCVGETRIFAALLPSTSDVRGFVVAKAATDVRGRNWIEPYHEPFAATVGLKEHLRAAAIAAARRFT